MKKRQPDLFEPPADTDETPEPEEIRGGLGLIVPFSKSRALVKLDLEHAEADRREPSTLTLDGDGPGEVEQRANRTEPNRTEENR